MGHIEMEKNDALHVESESVSSGTSNQEMAAKNRVDLSAKEQYRKLWTAIKVDRRFC